MIVGLSSNVIDSAFRGGVVDGIGVYTTNLETALRATGVAIRRIGARPFRGLGLLVPAQADLCLPLPLVPSIAWSRLTGQSLPFAAAIERSIDLYHCTDYLVPKLRRTPIVATLYDAIPLARPEWANPRLRGFKNWLLRSAAGNADRIIAISEAAVDDLVRHYRLPRERIRVVHLGVGDEWFTPPPADASDAVCRSFGLEPGYFLFVGTLQPRKNVAQLIEAYDRLEPTIRAERQLVIVGRYGWKAEDVRRMLESRRSAKRVLWLDYLDRNSLRAVYRNAGAFVFPSLAEGFGLPILEALACGLPVVASDIPVVREIAGEQLILVPPANVDALTDAMDRARSVPRGVGPDSVRRDWARRFGWERCGLQTVNVYRELIGR